MAAPILCLLGPREYWGRRWGSLETLTVAAAVATTATAGLLVAEPKLHPLLIAAVLAGSAGLVICRWPRGAALATLLALPFIALIRRMLILGSGWTPRDPLVLFGPAVATLLIVWLFVLERRRVVSNPLSYLVAAVLALAAVEVFNPQGGGLFVGAGGLLFIAAPLLWFFVGRELGDRLTIDLLLRAAIVIAVVIAAYGLRQTEVGLPSWDEAWKNVNGYYALNVGGVIRAFGTFSSAAEYAFYLGSATVISVAFALHGRPRWGLPAPFLLAALFLSSVRSALLLTGLALLVVGSLRFLPPRRAVAAVAVAALLGVVGVRVVAPALSASGAIAANPLAAHQVNGILNPFDSSTSTLGIHSALFVNGIESGFRKPLGLGTGATNLAGTNLGAGPSEATEIDVSNAFVSLGLPGGIIYLALVLLTLFQVFGLYVKRRDPLLLAVGGLLVATLGQWATGGHYALTPLTWFLIGWVSRTTWIARRHSA